MALSAEALTVIRSSLDASGYAAGAAQIAEANAKISASGDQVTGSQAKLTRSLSDSGAGFDRIRKQVDDAYASQQKMDAAISATNAAVNAGRTTYDQGAATLQAYAARLSGANTAVEASVTGLGQQRFVTQQLRVQFTQLFSQIASGQPIFMSLVEQGHQVADVMESTGTGLAGITTALKSTGSAILGFLLSPLGLAITGVTAFAAGAIYLGSSAETTAKRVGLLSTQLSGVRDDFASAANAIELSARRVSSQVTSAFADIVAAEKTILSVPQFQATGEQLDSFAKHAQALADVMGTTLPEAAKLYALAIQDPVAAVEKLGKSGGILRLLDAATLQLAKDEAQHGQAAKATQTIIDGLNKALATQQQNLTPLQAAWEKLSAAVGNTSKDTKSLADILGGAVDTAWAATISRFADLVSALNRLKGELAIYLPPNAARSDPLDAASLSDVPGLSSLPSGVTLGPRVASMGGQQAVGVMQVMPSTAAQFTHADIQTLSGNIEAGMRALQAYTNFAGNDPIGGLARYGGYGSNTQAASGYTSSVLSRDASKLPTDVAGMIDYWGHTLGMSDAMIQVGKQLALQESAGKQFGGTADSTLAQTTNLPGNIGKVATGGDNNELANQARIGQFGSTTPKTIADLNDQLTKLDALWQQQTKDLGPFNEATLRTAGQIKNVTANLQDAQDPSRQAIQSSIDLADRTRILGAADQALIGIIQKHLEEGRTRQDQSQRDEQDAAELAAKIDELSAGYDRQISSLDRTASQTQVAADAWGTGAKAARESAIQTQAFNDTLDHISQDAPDFSAKVQGMADALRKVADANDARALAPMTQGLEDQIAVVKLEIATLGQDSDARSVSIDLLQTEQKLRQQFPAIGDKVVNAYLEEKKTLDELNIAQKNQQAGLNEIANAFTSAFDTIGNAMAQAFIQGQGAAVNWGNVMKAVVQQVIQEFLKLAILNPLLNSLFGQNNQTLFSVLDAVGGAAAGGGIATGGAALSDASLLGLIAAGGGLGTGVGGIGAVGQGAGIIGGANSLIGALGFGNIGGQFSSIGNVLGLGNLFGGGGVGGALGGVGSFLNTPLIGGLAGGQFGPVTSGLAAGGVGLPASLTLGGLIGGTGAGFGLGSLAGNEIQSLLGKTGPAPQIGSGVGALGGTLIGSLFGGPLIGGLLGGLLGGAGGGLIGPKPASPYSSTLLGLGAGGTLSVGNTFSQGTDTSAQTAAANAQAAQLNQTMQALNVQLQSLGKIWQIGQNSPKGPIDPSKAADINTAFPDFKFTSSDPQLQSFLDGKTFSSIEDLSNQVNAFETFVKTTIPTTEQFGKTVGSLNTAFLDIHRTFDGVIAQAQAYGLATDQLTAAENAAIKATTDAANATMLQVNVGMTAATLSARDARMTQGTPQTLGSEELTALYVFDNQSAVQARAQLHDTLVGLYGDTVTSSAEYATEMGLLETQLGEQRLTIQQAFNDQILAAQKAADAAQKAADEAALAAQKQSAANWRAFIATNQQDTANYLTAAAQVSGKPEDTLQAQLYAFDLQANQQRQQLSDQMLAAFAGASNAAELYARGASYLELSLGEQRLAIQKQYDDQIAQAAKQAADQQAQQADQVVTSLGNYLTKLQFGTSSPLSPMDQYKLATQQFNAVSSAAAAGNTSSISQLPTYSDALLAASRVIYGAGAGYASDFQRVLDAINQAIPGTTDQLTALVFQTETRSQTDILSGDLSDVKALLQSMLAAINQSALRPARAA